MASALRWTMSSHMPNSCLLLLSEAWLGPFPLGVSSCTRASSPPSTATAAHHPFVCDAASGMACLPHPGSTCSQPTPLPADVPGWGLGPLLPVYPALETLPRHRGYEVGV